MPGFNICGSGGENSPPSTVETARDHRWEINILQSAYFQFTNEILLFAHYADRPRPEIDDIKIHHGQDEIYLPGKNRWSPVDIKFYEIITNSENSVTSRINNWLQTVVDFRRSKIATIPANFKGICKAAQLDGDDTPVYEYQLLGCWPKKVTPSAMDYTSSKISEVTVTIVYDKCYEGTPESV